MLTNQIVHANQNVIQRTKELVLHLIVLANFTVVITHSDRWSVSSYL